MDADVRKILGTNIKNRREELGFTQAELAQKAKKTSSAYIAFIEAGERNVAALDLMLIAKALGTTTSHLLGEEAQKSMGFMQALRAEKSLSKTDRDYLEKFFISIRKDE